MVSNSFRKHIEKCLDGSHSLGEPCPVRWRQSYGQVEDLSKTTSDSGSLTRVTTTESDFNWLDVVRPQKEKNMRNNKWEFEASHFSFIDFEKIAEDLSPEHPIVFVNHGETEKYVVIRSQMITKSIELCIKSPAASSVTIGKMYYVYIVDSEFVDWVDWARIVKRASWPENDRKNNTVTVSLPKI